MKILITGATGYIGKALVNYLSGISYYTVFALTRSQTELSFKKEVKHFHYNGSYESVERALQACNPDCIIHCAAKTQYAVEDKLDEMLDANFRYGAQLLQAMLVTGCKAIINTGSYWQTNEKGEFDPTCLYAALKNATEDLIHFYVKQYKISAMTLRLMDVYGPNDPRNKLLPSLLKQINETKEFATTAGEQLLDYIYIDDVISAYEQALTLLMDGSYQYTHPVFYVSSQKLLPLKTIITKFLAMAHSPLLMKWGEKAYYGHEIMCPYIGEILPGWQAQISLDAGLKILLDTQKAL